MISTIIIKILVGPEIVAGPFFYEILI